MRLLSTRSVSNVCGRLLLALALFLGACTSSEDGGPDVTVQPLQTTTSDVATSEEVQVGEDDVIATSLEWTSCDAFECATLTVPRDYSDPEGPTIEVAVSRQLATDGAERLGSLVFNPGGPGASGIEFLQSAVFIMPEEIQERFDLVGFDPRGVGASSAVDCERDLDDLIGLVADGDDAAWDELLGADMQLVDSCPESAKELAPYVGTNNAARDLDQLRAALGDEKLTYVGYSYGTRLGATYAELFPGNIRALVLDGGVRPTDDLGALELEQAMGFDAAFGNFADACDSDPDCLLQELGTTVEVFRSIAAEISEVGSFETDDPSRKLTPGEFYLGVFASLYSVAGWPFLSQALYTAEVTGDGTLLQLLGDNYLGRGVDGAYNNSQEANGFINCADDPRRPSIEEIRAASYEAAAQTEFFDDFFRAPTGCLTEPDALDPLILGPAAGAPPILVLGNTGDPATPYEWSVALADFLDSGVLYSVEAEGHTAFGSFDCVTPIVNAYLIDLEVPEPGGRCSPNENADFFPAAGESEIDQAIAFIDCLRDEGVDVGPFGVADILADPTLELLLEQIDINDPDTVNAVFACVDLLPL